MSNKSYIPPQNVEAEKAVLGGVLLENKTILDLPAELNDAGLAAAFKGKKVTRKAAALLPSSTSRETILFDKLFPGGLPEGADLMRELVKKIRSGEVDLTPLE